MEKGEKQFFSSIRKFNEMYAMPKNANPTIPALKRVISLKSILQDELKEIDEIIEKYKEAIKEIEYIEHEDPHEGWDEINRKLSPEKKVELLTDLADFLGDLVVYATSESTKYGLDMEKILSIIMESNFSKLGADGKPIKDERGYIVKGPNYFKPEPKIAELLKEKLSPAMNNT